MYTITKIPSNTLLHNHGFRYWITKGPLNIRHVKVTVNEPFNYWFTETEYVTLQDITGAPRMHIASMDADRSYRERSIRATNYRTQPIFWGPVMTTIGNGGFRRVLQRIAIGGNDATKEEIENIMSALKLMCI